MKINFLYSILLLIFVGCDNKENKTTEANKINFKCDHILKIKDDESTRLVFKIEYENKSDFNLKLNNTSRSQIKKGETNIEGFYLFNNKKNEKNYLFNSDDNFILLKPNSKKHFYLTLLYSDIPFTTNKSEILKDCIIKYNGELHNIKNKKVNPLTYDSIKIDLKKITLKETNYKRILFEKDLDTIDWEN